MGWLHMVRRLSWIGEGGLAGYSEEGRLDTIGRVSWIWGEKGYLGTRRRADRIREAAGWIW